MPSPREHSFSYRVEHWRGTPEDVVRLLKFIRHALDDPRGDGITSMIDVEYANGSQRFDSEDDFRAAEEQILGDTVTSIAVRGYRDGETNAAAVRFDYAGATATVASTDEIWAQGLLAILRRELDMRAQPPTQPGYDVPRELSVLFGAAAAFTLGLCVFLTLILSIPVEVGAIITVPVLFIWVLLSVAMVRDFARETEPFELISTEQATADQPHTPSWSHRAHAWITARPLLNLFLGFALGIATNKVSELL